MFEKRKCPMCGVEPALIHIPTIQGELFYVECTYLWCKCRLRTEPFHTAEEAYQAWDDQNYFNVERYAATHKN